MAYLLSERQLPINVGPLDRAIRVALGLVLIVLSVAGPQSLWGLAGVAPLLSGTSGYCPLYAILDFSTVRTPHRVHHHRRLTHA